MIVSTESGVSGSSGCGTRVDQLVWSVDASAGVVGGAKTGGGEAEEDVAGVCLDEVSFSVWVSSTL